MYAKWPVVLPEGDRKANMDIMKANKEANREEIKRMREENKELRLKLTQLQRVRYYYRRFILMHTS